MKKYEMTKGLSLDRSLRALVADVLPDLRIAAGLRITRASLGCGLLFAAVLALLPISAGAQCAKWDAAGDLYISQPGSSTKLDLVQSGRMIVGTALQTGGSNVRYQVAGKVEGEIDGDTFSIQISWQDNRTSVYNGKIQQSGRLVGETYDKNNARVRQPWKGQRILKCASPIESMDKMPATTPPSSKQVTGGTGIATTSSPKPPSIITSHAVFKFVGQPLGFVVLTWDGGPDHPNAEVWVKINNRKAAFVAEQGKGTSQMPVERGKAYEYILADTGKTLATVKFIVP